MNSKAIRISIIVPIYNVEDYVKPCIESIIEQSYNNLEIILVDDGSTDGCPGICDDYAKKDNRIHVIHKRNGGVTCARKAGISVATGDYVLCVDGDDWIEKDRIEVLVKDGILPSHADMIFLAGYTRDIGERSISRSLDIPIKLFENDEIENEIFPLMSKDDKVFLRAIDCSLCMWAIRRKLLLENQMLVDDRITYGEDLLCICFCLLEAKSVMTIQQGGYHYVQRASSITQQIAVSSDKDSLQMKIWYQSLKNQLEQKYASEKLCKMCDRIAVSCIMGYDYDLLLKKFPDYLFPFPRVNSGARIVVYGAGKFGSCFVRSLDKIKKCSVVLWVDQNQCRSVVPGHMISPRGAIFSVDFDYIVVAILDANVAKEAKRSLIRDGIPEEKIATMDASVITEDAIPDEIKYFSV